jgi:hypothetical protein
MTKFWESILSAAGGAGGSFELGHRHGDRIDACHGKIAMVGAEQPVKLAQVTVKATPLPE